ncbi:hypothetical protein AAL_04135 [Moelleriella libera RCEF 2490]|uniref:C6 transcription factor n=1 Tax=Moelleriella libera RCEF 2490 TaxID=1081109 RepID=A0A168BWM7_9HYPO|nr:hypothetical protein AAL_04135 [Moelleriella libera RCEF 2490]
MSTKLANVAFTAAAAAAAVACLLFPLADLHPHTANPRATQKGERVGGGKQPPLTHDDFPFPASIGSGQVTPARSRSSSSSSIHQLIFICCEPSPRPDRTGNVRPASMVSTRASSRAESLGPDASSTTTTLPASAASAPAPPPPTPRKRKLATIPAAAAAPSLSARVVFAHAPSTWTLLWMLVSLPLVVWDTCYVLGRPHTMEGGFLHWPLWSPYKLYGEIDYIYGWKAVHDRNGFTAAQGTLNVVETIMYILYLGLWYFGSSSKIRQEPRRLKHSKSRGAADSGKARRKRVVEGRRAGLALLIGFSAAVMTLSKTILYWCNEYFSSFGNIGHNNAIDLIFLWIIPKFRSECSGAWLIGSTYMTFSMGSEILLGLEGAHDIKKE